MSSSGSRHWLRWIIAGVVVVGAVVVGGPFVYIHFIEGQAPAPLSLKSSASPSGSATGQSTSAGQTASAGPVAGTWTIGSGPQVGYRVNEVLAGQNKHRCRPHQVRHRPPDHQGHERDRGHLHRPDVHD